MEKLKPQFALKNSGGSRERPSGRKMMESSDTEAKLWVSWFAREPENQERRQRRQRRQRSLPGIRKKISNVVLTNYYFKATPI